ncbi:PIR Superfamily Protein [Plasmodium ovale wallikeri]|uniref:PIR Superfamily Protein n=1 Tax=Plasmodium ovale wallikeri TaxID=864142 RepID=A0A1A8YNL3_PLAOA|nr:PIR Superfamily Protein [Plasmodium ovale wallikeri]SBT33554.1 PIR Superfamily Protein [Plasmodium ovale wallikeri]
MGIEVAYSGQSQKKSCMDEYDDMNSDDDKKIDEVNETNEEDSTFSQKCKVLREYLASYNAKYSHCFKGDASSYFLFTINSIKVALKKCTEHEKRQAVLESEKEKQIITADDSGEPLVVDEDSSKAALSVEKKSELLDKGKDETCESKQFEDQKQQCIEGTHSSEPESRNEEITSGSSQDVSLSNGSLSPNHGQPDNKAQSSASHSRADSLSDATTLESPETGEIVPQLDNGLRGVSFIDSESKNPSDVSRLGNRNHLNTKIHDSYDLISEHHIFPGASKFTITVPSVRQVDKTDQTLQHGAADTLPSEISAKESSPELSLHGEETSTISAPSPAGEMVSTDLDLTPEGQAPTGIPSTTGMLPHSDKSMSIVAPLPLEQSLFAERTASTTHILTDGIMLPTSQYLLASQTSSPAQYLSQSQPSTPKGNLSPQNQLSPEMEIPAQTLLLRQRCDHSKTSCDEYITLSQTDLQKLNMLNHKSGVQSTLHNGDSSSKGEYTLENHSVQNYTKSSTSYTGSGGTSIKLYVIIILVILAIILLSILLFKYACLRGHFSKKKKKKRQRIQEELDRIMYSPSIFNEKNMYLPYTRLENSYNDIAYEI